MTEGETVSPVFVSYATADRARALSVCEAIERRGIDCWISTRDVAPGENYQEAIVRALRGSRAMLLLFSTAANASDEIKKELSLASRYRVPVIALRLEDIEPSDAFAYELSTRQWIDAFEGWDKAIDALVARLGQMSRTVTGGAPVATRIAQHKSGQARRFVLIAAAGLFLVAIAAAAAWWWSRPSPVSAHSMTVRLAGFQLLSPDLPKTIHAGVDAEIAAAFNADGVVGVSTAPAPPPGAAPAYALGGTIQREGDKIHVITKVINERSGAALWSGNFDYDGRAVSKVPRRIAVDAGNVVRCGLFGASTYRKALPDPVLKDYMQFCQAHWDPNFGDGRKALVPAQRVVDALPDFSWGWAAVAGGYWKVAGNASTPQAVEEARASGRAAADRAIALDGRNSEALYIKAMLYDRREWATREKLFKRAVAAKRLDCGCEYHQYGWMLLNVGRVGEALERLRRANDMLALYVHTPLWLANALVVAGRPEEARSAFDAAAALTPDPDFAHLILLSKAADTDDPKALADPRSALPPELRTALLQGHRAAASGNAAAKVDAVRTLLALPADQQIDAVARLLADLGAAHNAFDVAARRASKYIPGPSIFWNPSLRPALNDPEFPAVAAKLGLITYWRTSRTKPDVCQEKAPPRFCEMI